MDTCDALIAGGGPAGSACAWRLRQAGLDVLIMDAATFPRDKVCAARRKGKWTGGQRRNTGMAAALRDVIA